MEFKGTKGKWEYYPISEESNGYINIKIPMGSITVYNGIYPYVFKEDKEKCVEILEANAKLIACAPEMLEFLIEAQCIYKEKGTLLNVNAGRIEQLIKKATE